MNRLIMILKWVLVHTIQRKINLYRKLNPPNLNFIRKKIYYNQRIKSQIKSKKQYSTSSTITQQKIIVDSDTSVDTKTIPYQHNSIIINNNYRSDIILMPNGKNQIFLVKIVITVVQKLKNYVKNRTRTTNSKVAHKHMKTRYSNI